MTSGVTSVSAVFRAGLSSLAKARVGNLDVSGRKSRLRGNRGQDAMRERALRENNALRFRVFYGRGFALSANGQQNVPFDERVDTNIVLSRRSQLND